MVIFRPLAIILIGAPRCEATPPRRLEALALEMFCNKYEQAVSPATRPNTTHPRSEEPPRRLAPWTPPAHSPAAYNPGIVPNHINVLLLC